MKAIQLLQARNTISRYDQRVDQELVFVMLVENIGFDKLVEVHWAGEDKVWHTYGPSITAPVARTERSGAPRQRSVRRTKLRCLAMSSSRCAATFWARTTGTTTNRATICRTPTLACCWSRAPGCSISISIRSYKPGNATVRLRSQYATPC